MVTTENFIYLGKVSRLFCFMRVAYIARPLELIVRMSCDVYNALINESMVRWGDGLVVYNVLADSALPIQPVYVRHVAYQRATPQEAELKRSLDRLLAAERPEGESMLVLTAVFESAGPGAAPARYELREIPPVSEGWARSLVPSPGVAMAPLQQAASCKPVLYDDGKPPEDE